MAAVAAGGMMVHDQSMNTPSKKSILLFGCGNMGGAMVRGWIAAGLAPSQFTVVDPYASGLPDGVHHVTSAAQISQPADLMLLAIKPQMLGDLQHDIATCLTPGATIISILAGIEISRLEQLFPQASIVRLMPNLAAAIGKSPMALCANACDDTQRAQLSDYLSPLGQPIWMEAEKQMNAVTALAGSGPAFVYRFIDALAAGGSALGLSQASASQLALSVVEGAAALAATSPHPPADLAAQVTSPGGTTAAGLSVLDADNALYELMENTLRAACERGEELGKSL
jgi:pyrroline-5-carboxylate reductase